MKNKKLVLVVMDGIGISNEKFGNAVMNANTPNLDKLLNNYPNILISAHGTSVGMPSDSDMGNSEVGHNALGCGQIYSQGAKLVNEAIISRKMFEGTTWHNLVNYCKEKGTMHFIGLLSDGNVHSNINHLFVLMEEAKKSNIKNVCIHILLDGRDVEEVSALKYVDMLEERIKKLNDNSFNAKIASGGGRMNITMDRYEANWDMVERGWHTHVLGDARKFLNATDAIKTYREESHVIDQDLDSFVIVKDNEPVGRIMDGDSVIFFNFRGDRALEISKCFDEKEFNKFDRVKIPKVMYAGMLQYDADLQIPKKYLTEPPKIKYTLTEELCKYGIREYAISETQKYGHVTYFWNGNRTEKFDNNLETYEKIDSDVISFDKKPEMKSYEITDKLINAINSNNYDFLRVNFPNGDMVGHTGNYEATIKAVEAVDENLGKIMNVIEKNDALMLIMADHGNAEEMYQLKDKSKKTPKTSHTLNKVPFIIYGKDISNIKLKKGSFGLSNVASTVTDLLGIKANENWNESIIETK